MVNADCDEPSDPENKMPVRIEVRVDRSGGRFIPRVSNEARRTSAQARIAVLLTVAALSSFGPPPARGATRPQLVGTPEAVLGAGCVAEREPETAADNPGALLWSTFLGGSSNDYPHGVVYDPSGCPIVAGYTQSPNFPTTPGAYDRTHAGSYDVFVAKFAADGSTLLWATFLGGGWEDRPFALVLDSESNPVIAGMTYSPDFPTTPGAYDRTLTGSPDGFVAKLDATGGSLIWSTFLGGGAFDRVWDLVLDGDDQPIVAGETSSSDFPTTAGAYDQTHNGALDGFVAKLDAAAGGAVWSTYLGGSYNEQVTRLALGPDQQVVLCGNTYSANFPITPGAYDGTQNGDQDCFLTILDPVAGSMWSSTFLGASGTESTIALAVTSGGEPLIAGSTTSTGFPVTPGAYDTTPGGSKDVFATRLNSAGTAIVWSTFLGGSLSDDVFSMALDPAGGVLLTGATLSADFPTTLDALDRSYGGNSDAYLARLSPSGSTLLWSSFIGGGQLDEGWELTVDATGSPLLTGPTRSPDIPITPGSYDQQYNGEKDVFLMRLDIGALAAAADPGGGAVSVLVGPNPFHEGVDLEVELLRPAWMSILAFDAWGRCVARVHEGVRPAGPQRFRWNGCDDRGRAVEPGVYWLRIEGNGGGVSRKIVRCR